MPEIWFPNLGITIEHLDKVAMTIFGQEIYWYGVLIGLGIFLAMMLMCHEAKRTGQNPDNYIDLLLIALVVGFAGARIYYVAFSWDNYKDDLMKIFAMREGGIAIYGGVIAGALAVLGYSKVKKKNFWILTDTLVPSLILGQAIGRWGNFINREAFGDYTDGFFAMRYQLSQVRIGDVSEKALNNAVIVDGMSYIQVHPTFLYESVWNFATLIFLLWLTRNKKFHAQVTAMYLIAYGIGRFWIEGLRTDQLQFAGVAVSQVVAIITIVLAVILILWKKNEPMEEIIPEEIIDYNKLTVDKLAEIKQNSKMTNIKDENEAKLKNNKKLNKKEKNQEEKIQEEKNQEEATQKETQKETQEDTTDVNEEKEEN